MGKRRKKPARKNVYGKLYSQNKTVTTIDKQELQLYLQRRHFKKPIYLKKGMENQQITDLINKKVRPEFERFFKNTRGKGKGNKYIFSMMTGMNFSGRHVKHGFSTMRFKLTRLEHFDRAIKDLLHEAKRGFLTKLQMYLARQGITSFSIRGVKMEVAQSNAERKKSTKRKARKQKTKAKSRSVRGSKR